MRNSGQVKKHVHSMEQISRGIIDRKIQRPRGLPAIQGRAMFAQCNDSVTASCELLAKLATNKAGRATN